MTFYNWVSWALSKPLTMVCMNGWMIFLCNHSVIGANKVNTNPGGKWNISFRYIPANPPSNKCVATLRMTTQVLISVLLLRRLLQGLHDLPPNLPLKSMLNIPENIQQPPTPWWLASKYIKGLIPLNTTPPRLLEALLAELQKIKLSQRPRVDPQIVVNHLDKHGLRIHKCLMQLAKHRLCFSSLNSLTAWN